MRLAIMVRVPDQRGAMAQQTRLPALRRHFSEMPAE
jgi:hypothetical protein